MFVLLKAPLILHDPDPIIARQRQEIRVITNGLHDRPSTTL